VDYGDQRSSSRAGSISQKAKDVSETTRGTGFASSAFCTRKATFGGTGLNLLAGLF
jgi:hypothetical protein